MTMKVEATNGPLKFHFSDGSEVRLTPGRPVELPEDRAERLLIKLPGRVRVLPSTDPAICECPSEPIIIEPAPESTRQRPVFWQSMADGRIHGPARVTDLARAGEEFWLWIEYQGQGRWIRDILLRSRAQFEAQRSGEGQP